MNRLFSSSPAVYLGRISYGTYLWHWPVILVAFSLTDHTISPLSTFAIAAFVATGLASLSYQLLEMPIRRLTLLDRISPVVIVAGVGISVIGALVIIPNIIDPYGSSDRSAQNTTTAGGTPVPALDFATRGATSATCTGRSSTRTASASRCRRASRCRERRSGASS